MGIYAHSNVAFTRHTLFENTRLGQFNFIRLRILWNCHIRYIYFGYRQLKYFFFIIPHMYIASKYFESYCWSKPIHQNDATTNLKLGCILEPTRFELMPIFAQFLSIVFLKQELGKSQYVVVIPCSDWLCLFQYLLQQSAE